MSKKLPKIIGRNKRDQLDKKLSSLYKSEAELKAELRRKRAMIYVMSKESITTILKYTYLTI